MRPIRTHTGAKENAQGRHYIPKSARPATQALDPITAQNPTCSPIDIKLRKLG
jgi:hypothetical protein